MNTILGLFIKLVVLCALGYFISWIPFPVQFAPLRWLLYVLLVIIAFMVLLPYLGIRGFA